MHGPVDKKHMKQVLGENYILKITSGDDININSKGHGGYFIRIILVFTEIRSKIYSKLLLNIYMDSYYRIFIAISSTFHCPHSGCNNL